MNSVASDLLGIGLYTPPEAAFYARVRTQTLNRWLYGDANGEAVLTPQLAGQSDKVVTFLDFVQSLAIREIRLHHRVPLPKIRKAITEAQERYSVRYPFAVENTAFLFGSDIVINIGGDQYADLTRSAGQRIMKRVAELYVKDLYFAGPNGLASKYCAFRYDVDHPIEMNPELRFGEPMFTSCGYTAQTLWEAYEAEGGIERVVKAYGVEPVEVEAACRYYDFLQGNAAA